MFSVQVRAFNQWSQEALSSVMTGEPLAQIDVLEVIKAVE
jgi:hypothetical protein